MTRCLSLAALFVLALTLSACETPDRYPISGEPCGPEDPVQGMTPPDCTPETLGAGM